MTLGVPAIDQPELTQECIDYLGGTSPRVDVVIIDNASDGPYFQEEWDQEVIRNEQNRGFYYPLKQLYDRSSEPLIGLIHNDLFVYEQGWDKRVEEAFARDDKLALIGFCGSNEVDDRGGRGGGTMSNFAGTRGQLQAHTGRLVHELHPALVLDSLAMIFRRDVIPELEIDEEIVPCHFYDKIWSLRLIDKGYRVGVMGIVVDHIGGQTSVGVAKYNSDARQWCDLHGLAHDATQPGGAALAIYLEAERRLFNEFGPKGLIPSRVENDWHVHRHLGKPKYPNGANGT